MRIAGRIMKSGGFWAVDVPLLDVATQGRTRAEAFLMIADAVEMLVRRKGFRLRIFPGRGEDFEIGSADEGALIALVLKRIRAKAGLGPAKKYGPSSRSLKDRYRFTSRRSSFKMTAENTTIPQG